MKLGWRFFIVFAAVGAGLYLSRKPWEVYRDQDYKSKEISAEMQAAEKERERLLKDKMKIDNPIGREQIIRDRGWIKNGEKPIEK
ncbi:MAG: hypothetical protein H7Y17_13070 [Chlorobia bacterium]|nr:hypothetical protein [Fimbriimonadaceae bacterium]